MRSACLLLVMVATAWGHGAEYQSIQGAVGLQVRYSDGSPMAWVDVSVFSPRDRDNPYQTGLSDASGAFSFLPDTSGIWIMVFDDGLGHGLRHEIEVGKNLLAVESHSHHSPLGLKILSGLAVIFGVSSLLYARSSRKGIPA